MGPVIRHNLFVDNETGIPRLHSLFNARQDGNTLFILPIVEAEAYVVRSCVY